MFIEEPVLAEQAEYYPRLAEMHRASRSPPASACSRASTSSTCSPPAASSIIQPDLSHAGGITECRKIAAMAEAYDVGFAPHCPLGPIALAACLQVDFVALQRRASRNRAWASTTTRAPTCSTTCSTRRTSASTTATCCRRPSRASASRSTRALVLERSKNAPDWRNPVWRHADGASRSGKFGVDEKPLLPSQPGRQAT